MLVVFLNGPLTYCSRRSSQRSCLVWPRRYRHITGRGVYFVDYTAQGSFPADLAGT
jgi:hypothetical protein